MTPAIYEPISRLVTKAGEVDELHEVKPELAPQGMLLRDHTGVLLARIEPLLHDHSVSLDLDGIDRIDAAGITALVDLYQTASQAGHSFSVTNVSGRVEQILRLVGLDHLLISHIVVRSSQFESCDRRSAA